MSRVMISTEDNALASELIRQARNLDLRVTVATSANTLDQVRLLNPDLLILDLKQRIDGRLLLARLKQDLRTTSVRVATVFGREDVNVQRFCKEHRVTSHDLKPLMPTYLEKLVGYRSVMNRRPAQVA